MKTTRSFVRRHHLHHARAFVLTAAVGLGLAGCASVESALHRETPREEVAGRVDASAAEVAEVNGRIDDAFRHLDDLLNHPAPDLQRQYQAYGEAVNRLEASSERLRERTEELQRKGREYLIEWDREIATIRAEDLRESMIERKGEVGERFENLQDRYAVVRDNLAPLLRRLNEMESALSVDLTGAGITNARGAFNDVRSTGNPAREALAEFGGALRRAADALAARGRGVPASAR